MEDLSHIYFIDWREFWFDSQEPFPILRDELELHFEELDLSFLERSLTYYSWTEEEELRRASRLAAFHSRAPSIGYPPDPKHDCSGLLEKLNFRTSGFLVREWNLHPVGSLLLTSTRIKDEKAIVIDYPIGRDPTSQDPAKETGRARSSPLR